LQKLFVTLTLLALVACTQPQDQSATFYVFGTTVEVILRDTDDDKASIVFATLQQRFQSMHQDWHAWEPGHLTDINRAFAEGRAIDIQDDVASLIRHSQALEKATGGRFNAAIGGLIKLWGFHTSDYPISGPPPTGTAIQSWLEKQPSSLDIQLEGLRGRSSNPGVQLDFGGIAKGYAVDVACNLLTEMGVKSAIVNAGGDLRAFGGNNHPWIIAINKPGGGIIGGIEIYRDEAVFTSGVAHRYRQDTQQRYPHIIDPRNGLPISGLSAATVVSTDGTLADAAATAILVAGANDWPVVARDLGVDTVLVIADNGFLYMTEKMKQRLVLSDEQITPFTVIEVP
jgi:thiamine biosynthesis lipoprotein